VQYNWDAGWNVINLATASRKEDNCGNLTVTYIHDPGKVVGTILARIDVATGTYRYYCQDIIGSTRSVWNQNKTQYASYDYTPYGDVYAHSGADVKHRFTGQEWDDAAELYYFPFRYYSPEIARWITRDPIGGINAYCYTSGNPASFADLLRLLSSEQCAWMYDMLEYESRWYTTPRTTSFRYSVDWSWSRSPMPGEHFTDQPIETALGVEIDFDWYIDVRCWASKLFSPDRVYRLGKNIERWQKRRHGDRNALGPYEDWKERNALSLLRKGYNRLSQLFPPEFMAAKCGPPCDVGGGGGW
jgi:RHS repeat-associated protein